MENQNMQQDIQFIRQMIENNKRRLVDNGIIFINGGIFTFAGVMLSTFMGYLQWNRLIPGMWLILIAVLIAANLLSGARMEKRAGKKTFGSEMFAATWIACGIPIVILTLLYNLSNVISLPFFLSAIAFIMGIGYFLTGAINHLIFMKWLALGWWMGGTLALFWQLIAPLRYLGVLFAILVFLFWIIPGLVIYIKWKRVYDDNEI